MTLQHPTRYDDIMAKADEITNGLRFLRTLPAEAKQPGCERIVERYIMLLHAKARAQFPRKLRRYLVPTCPDCGRPLTTMGEGATVCVPCDVEVMDGEIIGGRLSA
jgi:hypothetical protein